MSQTTDGGRIGSTQSTVWALKALVKYYKLSPDSSRIKGKGTFHVTFNYEQLIDIDFDERAGTELDYNLDFSAEVNKLYR